MGISGRAFEHSIARSETQDHTTWCFCLSLCCASAEQRSQMAREEPVMCHPSVEGNNTATHNDLLKHK